MPQPVLETHVDTIRTQFETHGHVYVSDVYDPDEGARLGGELDELFQWTIYSDPTALGEQKRSQENPCIDPNLHRATFGVLGAIGALATNVLQRDLWPALPASKTVLSCVDMRPIVRSTTGRNEETVPVRGIWHKDRPDIDGLVALTTYEGQSELNFKDETMYELMPGGVAFFDPTKSHCGSALVKRRAMVVARTKQITGNLC